MPFNRPALQDLITRIQSDFSSRLLGGTSVLRRSVLSVLSRTNAGAVHLLYGYLDWISKQAMPDTAESAQLARWAGIFGVTRKAATFANLNVTFTGSINGTPIPAGAEMQTSDGSVKFTLDAARSLASGTAAGTITAEVAGSAANLTSGTVLTLTSPIAGISSSVTVGSANVVAADTETDSALLGRLLSRIQNAPMGGAQNDYVNWALQVAGVTRAWCYPNNQGAGTVGVSFVMDNQTPSIIPNSTQVTAVQAYLTDPGRKPVAASVTVFAPTADTLNFTIQGISDLTIQAAVITNLQALLARESQPGGTLYLSHINQAIQQAAGNGDHVLVSPSANVVSAQSHIPVYGAVTWL